MRSPSGLQAPTIAFGRATAGDLPSAIRREWLVTNGIGGYAFGTLSGIATRRYHGLLVAATEPPVGRRVFVGGLVETATYGSVSVALHTHEFADGKIEGSGYEHVETFVLEGSVPVWTYAIGDALLERRVFMARDANTTYVRYRLARASGPARLAVSALVTDRDIHELTRGRTGSEPVVEPIDGGAVVHGSPAVLSGWPSSAQLRILARTGSFDPTGAWWWGFRYREETARGQDDVADLYLAGTHSITLQPGDAWTLVLSTEAAPGLDGQAALGAVEARDSELLRVAGAHNGSGFLRRLVLAADAFVVRRDVAPSRTAQPGDLQEGRSVIAGYPWFDDWGRDAVIALPGLTLATGRPRDGAAVLRACGRWIADGLLPNVFPSSAGVVPEYTTVDAALWYVQAVRAHHEATDDDGLLDELLPVLRGIVDAHVVGTRHGIGVDHRDGLLAAGEPGIALTWMDARLDDRVFTPRIGKPVEINALWYNALCTVGPWLMARGDATTGQSYMALADQVSRSFRARFWRPELGYLADVVDGPDGDDLSLRPNQVFALSLPFALLEGPPAGTTLDAIGRALLTSYGLRTLAPSDPAYRGRHEGDRRARDAAYHQGPAWAWLIGAYAEAVNRITGDRAAALSVLRPFEAHLADAGIGSISELFDGDAPHLPRGCPAQAWSVAEVLRVWRLLARE